MGGYDERRKSPRVPIHLEASMLVLFPEDTFRPQPIPILTYDLSMFGMRVMASDVTKAFYNNLLTEVRYAKIEIVLPGSTDPQLLHGRIVWVDFNTRVSPSQLMIGLIFERLTTAQHQAMYRALLILQQTHPQGSS